MRKDSLEKIKEDPNSLVPPISIDKQKNILDGNHRYFMSKKFGFKLIPVIYK
jgi:ParB-like chromosome segregation protein Spo0J